MKPKEKKKQSVTKVILDGDKLTAYAKKPRVFAELPFPELEGKFGMPKGKIPYIKVKPASLDDHLSVQTIQKQTAVIISKILEYTRKGSLPDMKYFIDGITQESSIKTLLEISIFKSCCIEPKFSHKDAVRISEILPEVVNRVAKRALSLSSLEMVP